MSAAVHSIDTPATCASTQQWCFRSAWCCVDLIDSGHCCSNASPQDCQLVGRQFDALRSDRDTCSSDAMLATSKSDTTRHFVRYRLQNSLCKTWTLLATKLSQQPLKPGDSHAAPSRAAEIVPAAATLKASSLPRTAFKPPCTPYQAPVESIRTLVSFRILRVRSCQKAEDRCPHRLDADSQSYHAEQVEHAGLRRQWAPDEVYEVT